MKRTLASLNISLDDKKVSIMYCDATDDRPPRVQTLGLGSGSSIVSQ
jgi:hypothetical protein